MRGCRYVDYKNITKVIEAGRIIYVDDGVLSFEVIEIVDEQTIKARCLNNGKISSKKGVNLPKTDVDLPPLSEKDKADLKFGVRCGYGTASTEGAAKNICWRTIR